MRNWVLCLVAMTVFFISCGQTGAGSISKLDNDRLTCLVLGYDSIIYYTGGSSQMQGVRKGKITDTAFVNALFRTIKDGGFLMTLKPGDGANMLPNFQEMASLASSHHVINRSVDSIDVNEEKAFGFSTPPQIKAAMQGQTTEPFKLNLPKDDPDSSMLK